MSDLHRTIQIIIIIAAFVAGVSWIYWGVNHTNENHNESRKVRYFQCLEKVDQETCDKIFYSWQTRILNAPGEYEDEEIIKE